MTATTSQFVCPLPVSRSAVPPRRISAQAGHALEKLGHAIEYLSDEFVNSTGEMSRGLLEAILLLMEVNRRIYSECPETRPWGQRLVSWFNRAA